MTHLVLQHLFVLMSVLVKDMCWYNTFLKYLNLNLEVCQFYTHTQLTNIY